MAATAAMLDQMDMKRVDLVIVEQSGQQVMGLISGDGRPDETDALRDAVNMGVYRQDGAAQVEWKSLTWTKKSPTS